MCILFHFLYWFSIVFLTRHCHWHWHGTARHSTRTTTTKKKFFFLSLKILPFVDDFTVDFSNYVKIQFKLYEAKCICTLCLLTILWVATILSCVKCEYTIGKSVYSFFIFLFSFIIIFFLWFYSSVRLFQFGYIVCDCE